MIRRILAMVAACALFSGACLALAGRAKEGYPLIPAVDQMSNEEVDACLHWSGLHVERFATEVPFRHALRLEAEEYRDGRLVRRVLDSPALTGSAGLHRLLLLAKQEPDGLKLSVAYLGSGESCGTAEAKVAIPVGDLSAVRWDRPRGPALAIGRRVEICRLYAGKQHQAHQTVVAVFVTLARL